MIHVYTGNGKGKTTCAFGLVMRAAGHGLKVCIFQFFKPESVVSGERKQAEKIKNIRLFVCKECHPMFGAQRGIKKEIRKFFKQVKETVSAGEFDMMVLDEIINAFDQNFIDKRSFISFLKSFPRGKELVLTGRGDISDIEDYADYITVMNEKKHPFKGSVSARKGVEF